MFRRNSCSGGSTLAALRRCRSPPARPGSRRFCLGSCRRSRSSGSGSKRNWPIRAFRGDLRRTTRRSASSSSRRTMPFSRPPCRGCSWTWRRGSRASKRRRRRRSSPIRPPSGSLAWARRWRACRTKRSSKTCRRPLPASRRKTSRSSRTLPNAWPLANSETLRSRLCSAPECSRRSSAHRPPGRTSSSSLPRSSLPTKRARKAWTSGRFRLR